MITIPNSIGKLIKLTSLDLSFNQLEKLPVIKLPSLYIDIDENIKNTIEIPREFRSGMNKGKSKVKWI